MTRPTRWALGLLICADLCLLAGCPKPLPPKSAATVTPDSLPTSVPELIAFADKSLAEDSPGSVENALMAADKAHGLERGNAEVLVRMARACAMLAEAYPEREKRRFFADHGVDAAKELERIAAPRVEGHYYHGSNLGFFAATKTVGAVLVIPEVVRAAKRAIERNERYDHAGPLRLLGTVLSKAPPWPASVGDVDEGIKYLRRAVDTAPEYPLNHLFLADALLLDERTEEAAGEYQRVLKSEEKPEWAYRMKKWRADATSALKKLDTKSGH